MYEFYIASAIMPYCIVVILMLYYFCMQIVKMKGLKCNYL